jgi:hypothetical protein
MTNTGAVLRLNDGRSGAAVRVFLLDGNPQAKPEALDRLPGKTSYFLGKRGSWRPDVPQFAKVLYSNAYPGIDLVYYGSGQQLEYDFVVAPGADASRVRLRFDGADSVRIADSGALVLDLKGHEVWQTKPAAYQETAGGRREYVEAGYRLENGEVRLTLGRYDRSRTLVVDPILAYAGYIGAAWWDMPTGIAIDSHNDVWLTGTTLSNWTVPEDTSAYDDEIDGFQDVFVAKLHMNPSGPPTLLYFTYYGAELEDRGGDIYVDSKGVVYIAGSTYSVYLPTTEYAYAADVIGEMDFYAAKLDPTAEGDAQLVFSTYLGGTGSDYFTCMHVNAAGQMYLAGYTTSGDDSFITDDAVQKANRGDWEGLIIKIDPSVKDSKAVLQYGTYFGGAGTDKITGLGVDGAGNIYFCGYTMSEEFPVAGREMPSTLGTTIDAFVVKLDMSYEGLDQIEHGYASYIGGSDMDIATTMCLDSTGGVWVAGYTLSEDFPITAGAYQSTFAGGVTDAFLIRVDTSSRVSHPLTYSTFFGGTSTEVIYGLSPVWVNQLIITGYALSEDLPLKGAIGPGATAIKGVDAFVAMLDPGKCGDSALTYSTYINGSSAYDVGTRIAADSEGKLYVIGYTSSPDLPVTDGSKFLTVPGGTYGFLLRIDPVYGDVVEADEDGSGTGDPDAAVTTRRTQLGVRSQPRGGER